MTNRRGVFFCICFSLALYCLYTTAQADGGAALVRTDNPFVQAAAVRTKAGPGASEETPVTIPVSGPWTLAAGLTLTSIGLALWRRGTRL